MSTPSVNINKVCLSGLNTIYLADQMIAAGEADIVVAGGMESMTNAPYLADGARAGFRYGNTELRRRDHRRRPVVRLRRLPHGPRHRALRRRHDQPRGAGRARRHVARAGGQRDQGRPLRRRDRTGVAAAAQGRPDRRRDRRGRPPRHDGREPRRAAAGVRQGRHDHGRQRVAAQRRRQRPRADVGEGGRGARRPAARPGRVATAWSPGPTRRRCCSSRATPSARRSGAPASSSRRHRPVRDQRGVRRRRPGLDGRPRASPATSSTSTAGPSPSATRSA